MPVVFDNGWLSVAVGILRQELDSMLRIIFLRNQPDGQQRARLLHMAVSGEVWTLPTRKGKLPKVHDKDMVEFTVDRELVDFADGDLDGWLKNLYDFGCNFIHLSNCHDYHARDPFAALPDDERLSIARYLRRYHKGDASADSTFEEISTYFPKILEKISTSLESQLKGLEHDLDLEASNIQDSHNI